jgi:hypothetical protein
MRASLKVRLRAKIFTITKVVVSVEISFGNVSSSNC